MRFRLLPQQSHLGWTPYAWLIYLSFYVVWAFFNSRTALDWAINTAGLLAFLALYFPAFWTEGGRLVALFREGSVGKCRVVTRAGDAVSRRYAFDGDAPVLKGFEREEEFAF